MEWESILNKPEHLNLNDNVRLKNNFLAKVTGFTRNTCPRIYILEIIDGYHLGEVVKVEIEEVLETIRINNVI